MNGQSGSGSGTLLPLPAPASASTSLDNTYLYNDYYYKILAVHVLRVGNR